MARPSPDPRGASDTNSGLLPGRTKHALIGAAAATPTEQ
jgi:hypothetical protein